MVLHPFDPRSAAVGDEPREREHGFLQEYGEALGASEQQLAGSWDFARRSFEVYRVGLDVIAEGSGTDEDA